MRGLVRIGKEGEGRVWCVIVMCCWLSGFRDGKWRWTIFEHELADVSCSKKG
jgi:hypothetical protein